MVFFVGRPLAAAGPPTVRLQEEETDLAVWLSAEQVAHTLAHPLGGAVGTVPAAAAAPGLGSTVALDALAGIYPRAAAAPGEAGGDGVQLGLACAHTLPSPVVSLPAPWSALQPASCVPFVSSLRSFAAWCVAGKVTCSSWRTCCGGAVGSASQCPRRRSYSCADSQTTRPNFESFPESFPSHLLHISLSFPG